MARLVKACAHAVADYQYGTWHKCRDCGAWVERVEANGKSSLRGAVPPLTFLEFTAKGHASVPATEPRFE